MLIIMRLFLSWKILKAEAIIVKVCAKFPATHIFFGEVENWVEVLPIHYSTLFHTISTCLVAHTYSCQLVEETPQFISLLLPFGKLLCLHSVNIFVFFHWNMYNDFSFFYFSGKRTNLKYFGQYSNILPSNNIQGILTMPYLHPTFW